MLGEHFHSGYSKLLLLQHKMKLLITFWRSSLLSIRSIFQPLQKNQPIHRVLCSNKTISAENFEQTDQPKGKTSELAELPKHALRGVAFGVPFSITYQYVENEWDKYIQQQQRFDVYQAYTAEHQPDFQRWLQEHYERPCPTCHESRKAKDVDASRTTARESAAAVMVRDERGGGRSTTRRGFVSGGVFWPGDYPSLSKTSQGSESEP